MTLSVPKNILHNPGEYPFLFDGIVGQLETILTVPPTITSPYIALLGHPHSLYGGSITNKVVTTMASTFKELGIPSLRFNFRGVGQSVGFYDKGIGESEDMLVLKQLWAENYLDCRFLFAGFSFGSYVVYRAAALSQHDLLITVAPPVHHYNYHEFSLNPESWYILQGDADEIVPVQEVLNFSSHFIPAIKVVHFAETGHFFHGKLLILKSEMKNIIRSFLSLT